jgi:hypothetical protein
MSKVATQNPDPNDDSDTEITQLPDTAKSGAHVSQLLTISEHCAKYLWAREEIGTTLTVDPILTKECRATIELAHEQLRNLIDETRRWSLDPTRTELESSKLIDSTMALYDQKTVNAKIYNRPSLFLRPQIRLFDKGWFVWSGWPEGPRNTDLYGRGDSPALAMQAFDAAYYDLKEATEKQSPQPAPKRAPRKNKTT